MVSKTGYVSDSDSDDDFQRLTPVIYLSQTKPKPNSRKLVNTSALRSRKKPRPSGGKENRPVPEIQKTHFGLANDGFPSSDERSNIFDQSHPIDSNHTQQQEVQKGNLFTNGSSKCRDLGVLDGCVEKKDLTCEKSRESYGMSIESRLLAVGKELPSLDEEFDMSPDFEPSTQLNELMNLCAEISDKEILDDGEVVCQSDDKPVECPLCQVDITLLNEERRNAHTNHCLDVDNTSSKMDTPKDENCNSMKSTMDVSPVLKFLSSLGLSRYEEIFVKEEIDWDTMQLLTEEDLFRVGIIALGPRKKIVCALNELGRDKQYPDTKANIPRMVSEEIARAVPKNKLITEYFQGSTVSTSRACARSKLSNGSRVNSCNKELFLRNAALKNHMQNFKLRDIPSWCSIPGTPFRVDAFRFLRPDCTYWFLTHFHTDHYQGITKNFRNGKIYCSQITAKLLNMKIGVPFEKLHVIPLNQKTSIAGVDVTFLDANHCPGSVIILFEPPNCNTVLHTGDFRFCEAMANCHILRSCNVHTLILDTTYCNPQYDFPKQESIIQFVIEAIQAEAFNPNTLFLIGTYTIGKERLFCEVARILRKKVYVGTAAKLRLLECLGLPPEDMQWFTLNEMESNVHVVPLWSIASFKRMKHLTNLYSKRYNLIVAFSPTGWSFGTGKKKSATGPGKKWQQGTIIRYEVPYSEHSSFSELKEFVQFISPKVIIPSVNNKSQKSADAMVSLLM
ncbi:DNA cross-link repair 1A protein [Zostera marina]|uniref:DNA cross-link repair 1A protein n=1 Tax=Zostera marina TaxID=29655 RepID=A0A0K9NWX8_ZOSMR|nr:DNA cross-link repair 1A protein [Zostera marina]